MQNTHQQKNEPAPDSGGPSHEANHTGTPIPSYPEHRRTSESLLHSFLNSFREFSGSFSRRSEALLESVRQSSKAESAEWEKFQRRLTALESKVDTLTRLLNR